MPKIDVKELLRNLSKGERHKLLPTMGEDDFEQLMKKKDQHTVLIIC